MVQITLRVLTRPNPDKLPQIYREIGIGSFSREIHGEVNCRNLVCYFWTGWLMLVQTTMKRSYRRS